MKTEIIKGDKLWDRLPEKVRNDVLVSFEDHGLKYEKDIQYCELHIMSNGICNIHDTRDKTWRWNGTLIATFKKDGRGFYFTKNSDRNTKRLNEYDRKRAEFFKVPRTAWELGEFEKKNRP